MAVIAAEHGKGEERDVEVMGSNLATADTELSITTDATDRSQNSLDYTIQMPHWFGMICT